MMFIEVKDNYNSASFDLTKVTHVYERVLTSSLVDDVALKGLEVCFLGGEPLFLEGFSLKAWQDLINQSVQRLRFMQPVQGGVK